MMPVQLMQRGMMQQPQMGGAPIAVFGGSLPQGYPGGGDVSFVVSCREDFFFLTGVFSLQHRMC